MAVAATGTAAPRAAAAAPQVSLRMADHGPDAPIPGAVQRRRQAGVSHRGHRHEPTVRPDPPVAAVLVQHEEVRKQIPERRIRRERVLHVPSGFGQVQSGKDVSRNGSSDADQVQPTSSGNAAD